MKIYYWSPFLTNIATIDAVVRSIKSILTYGKKRELTPYLIDSTGEWNSKKEKIKDLNVVKLYKKNFHYFLPKTGFLKSRFSQIFIFIYSFRKLKNLLVNEKPEFLLAHLIISLPLLLFSIYSFETKLIIRISGTPKLNIFRKLFWSTFSKNIYKVTCPTITTYNKLKDLKIFPKNKLVILRDPILSVKEIQKKKNEPIDPNFRKSEFIIGIGRLTEQKNFKLLIKAFCEINKIFPKIKLIILGEGENRLKLEKLIKELNLDNKVFLVGYKKNVFNYINKAKCFISSSLYEDPGFAILEAGFLNKIVFASNSNTGPSEIIKISERGFLFENNQFNDLVKIYLDYTKMSSLELKDKILKLKKYSKNYTIFHHFLNLRKILLD
tara:strand:+ start:958 stop:2100 length:1143 start_codon:yes stop_codon:yes gene_type:complete